MSLSATEFVPAAEIRAERRWIGVAVGAGLTLGLLACIGLVVAEAVAQWHFGRDTPEEIAKAIAILPDNAALYAARARALQMSLEGTDVNQVIGLYEAATQLIPGRASYWSDLGGSYEWAGREDDARRAYEHARELFPNSPEVNWKLGNFYVRAGQMERALGAFQKTVRGDPALRRPAYDLAWRAGLDNAAILEGMVPADRAILISYLNFLVETQRLDDAAEVWQRLLGLGGRLEPRAIFPYLYALIHDQRGDEARAVWQALAERSRNSAARRNSDTSLITNGSFEDEILNGGLDWYIYPVEGAAVSVDHLTFFDGTRSVRIRFDGTRNLDFGQVFQFVPVAPNTAYRLTGYLRAAQISSDTGLRFRIEDAGNPSRLRVETEAVVGTVGWSPVQLEFRTAPETHILILRVARPPSHSLDGRISGTAWVDRVSLHAVE